MKDIFVLFVLVIAQLTKVFPQPYQANGNCQDPKKEYLLDGTNLCCRKCQPGQRLVKECSENADSVCEQCEPDQFMQDWNYAQNCFSCVRCKSSKGLEYAQNCSTTTKSRCRCKLGWYCTIGYDNSYCSGCEKYKPCKVGYGVSTKGTPNSNVKCKLCSSGTFSDTESYTDPCRAHTDCGSRAVVRKGNNTSDTVCEPVVFTSSTQTSKKELPTKSALTTASTTLTHATSAWELRHSTQSVSEPVFNYSTKGPTPSTRPDTQTAGAVICGVLFLFFAIILLLFCKSICKKDAGRLHPKLDANGNCENGDKVNQGYVEETLLTSFAVTSPEQQCLLETGEASSDCSQCNNNTETLTRTEGSSSHESISPLQSTVLPNNPSSALSEPLPLISNTDPVTSQSSVHTQSSSQPTSPHIISPVTTSPHVNVNITFHIGNGSCGTPPVNPADLIQAGCKLPLGREEESFSIPQQEDGKQSLISVQESSCYSV